jgi:small, acid-soluble spore protein I
MYREELITMDISIRGYIKNNFKNADEKEITEAIEASIKSGEEETLPGIGVFFELLWQNSSAEERNQIIGNVQKGLK